VFTARPCVVLTLIATLAGCQSSSGRKDEGTGGAGGQGTGGGLGGSGGTQASGGAGGSAGSGGSPLGGAGGAGDSGGAGGAGGATTGAGGASGGGGAGAGGAGGSAGASGTMPAGGSSGAGGSTGANGDGPVLSVDGGKLKIQVCDDDIIRVAYAKDAAFFTRATLATAAMRCKPTAFTTTEDTGTTTVATAKLQARVDTQTGAVTFLDATGQTVLAEKGGGRTLTSATVGGEATNNIRQEWLPNDDESLYGLGQHQHGLFDIKGLDFTLHQYNTEVVIPFLVSSRGYGVLWDNTSLTKFGDLAAPVPLPGVTGLYASGGTPGDVSPGSGTVDWSGSVTPTTTGDYTFKTFSAGNTQLTVNGKLVIDHWRQGWLPNEDVARVHLTAGQAVPIKLHWESDIGVNIIRLLWKAPVASPTTSLWSEVGDGVDYWFVYGPDMDRVVGGYRQLTGTAPMMPLWAYGFWQCKERYQSAQEITDVLKGYRDRKAPIDNIVQDWQYWLPDQWGSHQFDSQRYPDPAGWIKTIHDTYHARLMISVWPKFYTSTQNYKTLDAQGFVYKLNVTEAKKDFVGYVFTFYDAFSAAARQMFWSQVNTQLFSKGVDAWWLDATEPDIVEGPFKSIEEQVDTSRTHMNPTGMGTGSRMLNAYSLVNSQAVYEGQRQAAPNQRVFILTRNGFAGQQRYAAATWSGDISATWTAMRKQLPAGLGFAMSGMPYWTLDSGGFAVPPKWAANNPSSSDTTEWRELSTRWFEWATFLPLMRVHGQAPAREMWQFGGDTSTAYAAMLKFDRIRYRLLPYIYSLAGMVTQNAGTIMRPLVMDFRTDATAREVSDEYMFGPALLVCPVTSYTARTRSVYLPPAAGWYDLWGGNYADGAQTVTAPAPFDAIPVYVRAGSIVPIGPDLQYTSEKPFDPITLFVYAGADGAFTLYEDQGTSYDYEQGAFATIPLRWNDGTRTLTIGARTGSFPGMLTSRSFQIVVVSSSKAVGFSPTALPTPDKTVTYTGTAMDVAL
jgi:alpha-D-xyloside xylohydrolase